MMRGLQRVPLRDQWLCVQLDLEERAAFLGVVFSLRVGAMVENESREIAWHLASEKCGPSPVNGFEGTCEAAFALSFQWRHRDGLNSAEPLEHLLVKFLTHGEVRFAGDRCRLPPCHYLPRSGLRSAHSSRISLNFVTGPWSEY